ncbi:unnamed protein product [Nippostrongylus brasiliensis]|uniref:LITAF domain-containing protein n=1 Tax=Nippostrongylus brasiliensis TaxID=27835 RepID=A0A0N4YGZ7_NIPBR|nr:hypothetical protein Q1695_008969 [Nippostrongylus brasiliensis]VDL79699.1 unnamed protein product [Nippostrongylus brasiliensis]
MAESKAAEAAAAPAYEEGSSASRQPSEQPHTVHNQHPPPSVPMFVSARQSLYGPCPVEMDCPHCQAHIVSHIERVAGVLPWILCGICVLLGFFLFLVPWCFCGLPFCMDQCLDVVHSCPACKRHLGRFNRI